MNFRTKRVVFVFVLVLFVSKMAFCSQISVDNTEFALKIYEKLQKADKNLVFSPYSLSVALSMTYAGARGETADQMGKTLCFSMPQDNVPPAFATLQEYLNSIQLSGHIQLSIANSIWPQKSYPFLTSYLQLISRCYGEQITPLDYEKSAEKARKTINKWVKRKTMGKITNIIEKNTLDPFTRLVLVNAIYFKGEWAEKFDKRQTLDSLFHVNSQKTVKIPFMYAKKDILYAENDDFQLVSLPYKGNGLSMVIFLPKMDRNVPKNVDITFENLEKWQKMLGEQEVELHLPKFRITWGAKRLKNTLVELGMALPFDCGKADFSGMDGQKGNLYISEVMHKAFIEVNEEGTEVAAATAVIMDCYAADINPVFRADHPFTFIIQDNRTGSILFMGKVNNPAE